VKPGREGPTIPVQLRGGLRSPNRIVTPVGTTTIYLVRGIACIDNASTPRRWLCLGPFPAVIGKWPPRGLHSHQTWEHIYNKTISDSTMRYVNAQLA
jgi:hypothetical protein